MRTRLPVAMTLKAVTFIRFHNTLLFKTNLDLKITKSPKYIVIQLHLFILYKFYIIRKWLRVKVANHVYANSWTLSSLLFFLLVLYWLGRWKTEGEAGCNCQDELQNISTELRTRHTIWQTSNFESREGFPYLGSQVSMETASMMGFIITSVGQHTFWLLEETSAWWCNW